MKIQAGQTVLLTGASGGLGVFITRAFIERRTHLALVAHPGIRLDALRQEAEQRNLRVMAVTCDLRDPEQRRNLCRQIRNELGPIDVLINNAGVEFTAFYHELEEKNIQDVVSVNLEAPLFLSRLVLPEMLQRKRGHIVNISSLAGKSGPAFQEPYAATKAALMAFTSSLRATYAGSGVSASVIVPGFVEAGIYTDLKRRAGCSAPALLGSSPPEKVARAVIRAIEEDSAEIIINPIPVRPLLAFTALFPRVGEWISNRIGANRFFQRVVDADKRK